MSECSRFTKIWKPLVSVLLLESSSLINNHLDLTWPKLIPSKVSSLMTPIIFFSFQKILFIFFSKTKVFCKLNSFSGEKSKLMRICTLSMLCVQSRVKPFLSKACCFFPLYQIVEEAQHSCSDSLLKNICSYSIENIPGTTLRNGDGEQRECEKWSLWLQSPQTLIYISFER